MLSHKELSIFFGWDLVAIWMGVIPNGVRCSCASVESACQPRASHPDCSVCPTGLLGNLQQCQ